MYACWALVSLFFYEYFLVQELTHTAAAVCAGIIAFSVIAAGGLGSSWESD